MLRRVYYFPLSLSLSRVAQATVSISWRV